MKKNFLLLLIMIMFGLPAFADVVWPSLYIAGGMLSVKVIILGLITEFLFVKYFADISWLKAFITAFVMNLVTCILGIILIPVSGLLIEFITPFGSTFHWSHWLLSYLAVVLINTLTEGGIIILILKCKLKSVFWWLFAANIISVLICVLFYGVTMDGIK